MSVKDRIAVGMIEGRGRRPLEANTTVVEATTGNTAIGLAIVCAVKKYRLLARDARELQPRISQPAFGLWGGIDLRPRRRRG